MCSQYDNLSSWSEDEGTGGMLSALPASENTAGWWAQAVSAPRIPCIDQGSRVESQSCDRAVGSPKVNEQSKASNHLSNKEGDRSLYLKPGHGGRKLGNQKLEKSGVPVDSIGRAWGEECDKALQVTILIKVSGVKRWGQKQISTGRVSLTRLLSQCDHRNRTNSYRQ